MVFIKPKVVKSGSKWFKVVLINNFWFSSQKNGFQQNQKWLKVVQSGSKWFKVVFNKPKVVKSGSKWFKVVSINNFWFSSLKKWFSSLKNGFHH